jgi:multiple sugar transport system permease protein
MGGLLDARKKEQMQPIGEVNTNLILSKKSSSKRRNFFFGMLFAGPAILGFFLFTLGPMMASLIYSFTDYSVFKNKLTFVGWDNFIHMFSGDDPFFYKSLSATFYYVGLGTPSFIIFAFALAMLLNTKIKGLALFRTILYLPSIIPVVASAMLWLWLFNPDLGLLNNILSSIGIPKSNWISSETMVIPSIVIMGLWGTGGTMVIFLAGLKGIPDHYYEAVEIDGGSSWHKFIYITIPMITPTLFFTTVTGFIASFQVFTEAYILTEGGPNNASLFYAFNIYRVAFRNTDMGYASALSWVLFVIIMVFTFLIFRSSKWVYYEGDDKGK